ncbi:MAG: hypothetical protein WD534_04655 [Phycisphaeraceae bacterium]
MVQGLPRLGVLATWGVVIALSTLSAAASEVDPETMSADLPEIADHATVKPVVDRFHSAITTAGEEYDETLTTSHATFVQAMERVRESAMQRANLDEVNAIQAALDKAANHIAQLQGQAIETEADNDETFSVRHATARRAMDVFSRRLTLAKHQYERSKRSALTTVMQELEHAKRALTREGDVASANAVAVLEAELRERWLGRAAQLYVAAKGEIQIYHNREMVAEGATEGPVELQLARDDFIFVRVRSPFVYRVFRAALVVEGEEPVGWTTENCLFLGEATPDEVTEQVLQTAPRARTGRADGHSPGRWSRTGGPDVGEWLGLPSKGRWYLYAFQPAQ